MTADSIDIVEQIECVKRELTMREYLYPRWVLNGKMAQHKSDRELAAMRAVLATLVQVQNERRPELAL